MASQSPVEDIMFLEDYRIIVCRKCGCAIPSSQVVSHVRGPKHGSKPALPIQDALSAWVITLNAIEDPKDFVGLQQTRAVRGIPVVMGLLCQDCIFVAGTDATMIRHRQDQHAGMPKRQWSKCSCQQIWGSYYKTYTLVLDGSVPDSTGAAQSMDEILSTARELFSNAQQDLERRFSQVPITIPPREATPWMKRTKWAQVIAGLDSSAMARLTAPPRPEEQQLLHVQYIFKSLVGRAYENSSSTPSFILKSITSHSRGSVKGNPTSMTVTEETLEKYVTSWFKMLCPLLREDGNLEGSYRSRFDELVMDSPRDEKQQGDDLLGICIQLLQAKIFIHNNPPALIRALAICGFDCTAKVFKEASNMSQFLAGLKFVSRLLIMEFTFGPEKRSDPNTASKVSQFCDDHIVEESGSVHSEICSLLAYARAHKDDYGMPTITWGFNNSRMSYIGNSFEVATFKKMLQTWEEDLVGLLPGLTFSTREECLQRFDPAFLTDKMLWKDCGKCFLDMDQNSHLRDGQAHMLKSLLASGQKAFYFEKLGSTLHTGALTKYRKALVKFQELLAVCLHCLGGGPARGTEFFNLKWRNEQTNMRSVYIDHGEVLSVGAYHKSQNLTDHPKMIARYYPKNVSRCLVAYLSDILPFHSLLTLMSPAKKSLLDNPYLFTTYDDGKKWGTERLTEIMSRESLKHLGFAITVASYRQIQIALRRKFLGFSSEVDPEASGMGALQTGHTETTEKIHYAITSSGLQSLTADTLEGMRQESKAWHDWVGASKLRDQDELDPFTDPPDSIRTNTRTTAIELNPHRLSAVERNSNQLQDDIVPAPYENTGHISQEPETMEDEAAVESYQEGDSVPYCPPAPRTRIQTVEQMTTMVDISESPNLLKRPHRLLTPFPSQPLKKQRAIDIPQATTSGANTISTIMTQLFPPLGTFRSKQQQEMVEAVHNNDEAGGVFVLPTAGGKTLALIVPCRLDPKPSMTIAIIPFVALLDSLLERCRRAGVSTARYDIGFTSIVNLLLVSAELAATTTFSDFVKEAHQNKVLRRIVIDEIHVILKDGGNFRPCMDKLDWIVEVDVPKFYMTATLPKILERRLKERFACRLKVRMPILRASTERPNISYNVETLTRAQSTPEALARLILEIAAGLPPGGKMIVYAGTIELITKLGELTGFPIYHHRYEDKEKSFRMFTEGRCQVIIGSSSIGTGIDNRYVWCVLHVGAVFGLIDFYQESGRAGRAGEPAVSRFYLMPADVARLAGIRPGASIKDKERVAMKTYLVAKTCRRAVLNSWFDLQHQLPCGNRPVERCDNCRPVGTHPFEATQFTQPPQSSPVRGPQIAPPLMEFSEDMSWETFLSFLSSLLANMGSCPLCFMQSGPHQDHPKHDISACPYNVQSKRVEDFRLLVSPGYTRGCHFICDLPMDMCRRANHAGTGCDYLLFVMAVCLVAYEERYRSTLMEVVGAGEDISDQFRYGIWLAKTRAFAGKEITNAIYTLAVVGAHVARGLSLLPN